MQGVAAPEAVEGAFKDLHIETPAGFKGLTDTLIDAYQDVQKAAITAISGLTSFGAEYAQIMNNGSARVTADLKTQQTEVENLSSIYTGMTNAVIGNATDTAASLQARADALAKFSASLKDGTSQF